MERRGDVTAVSCRRGEGMLQLLVVGEERGSYM